MINLLWCGSSRSETGLASRGSSSAGSSPAPSLPHWFFAGTPAGFAKSWAEHETQVSQVLLECTFWPMVIKWKQVKLGEKRKGQSTYKSCHKGRSPVILKQITLLRKSNADIKSDKWQNLISTVTFMVSLHPMCIYKKIYKIYEFPASVRLKFRKIERAVISKKHFFSPEVCWEHSVQRGNPTYYFLWFSSVFKYVIDFCSCSQNSQLFLSCLFSVLRNQTRALGRQGH